MPKPKFAISKEKRDEMTGWIKEYYRKERDEDIGDLSAILLLDFFMDKIAPEFYNQGVYDSQRYMSDKCLDLLGLQK
jgi:uncharacterized protein (DUF2164 family)